MKKKVFIRLLGLVQAMILMIGLTACGPRGGPQVNTTPSADPGGSAAVADAIVWRVGNSNGEDYYYNVYMKKLGEMVSEKTNGAIKFEIYPNSQLGDDNAMGEMIRNGNLDMMITGACMPGNWYQPMKMMEMAGLFDSWEHVERAIYGKPGEIMKEGCKENGMILWDNWMRTTWQYLSTVPIETAADFNGVKARVPGIDAFVIAAEAAYGLNATPIAFGDTFTSLQQNVVSGVFNPISAMYTMRFHELCNYLVITDANYDFAPILVSEQSWNKLTDEQKAIMEECRDIIREEVNEYIKTEDATYIEMMKADNPNLTVVEIDNSSILEKGREVADAVTASCEGQELYDAIRACAD